MDTKHAEYNIHNYVQDTEETFDINPFNEVDGLVLTQIANMDLGSSGIDLYTGESKSFSEIYKDMMIEGTVANDAYVSMSADNKALIKELASSPRYKDMIVSNYVNNPITGHEKPIEGFTSVGDDSYMEQFAAVTITYKQNGEVYNYVSYQATNDTTDGWTEDLAMLCRSSTQAQADSAAYMNIIGGLVEGNIVGGGHSKGGNDFEYAYLFCDEEVRKRIVKGYIYDSPGLETSIIEDNPNYERFQEIVNGTFYAPQDAIIGLLLHENENPRFVHSVESGFLEHDPYTWELDPKTATFVPDEQTELSKQLNIALDRAVEGMSQEEREAFFSFLEYVMYNNGGESLDGIIDLFSKGWEKPDEKLAEIWDVLSGALNNMTEEERKEFFDSIGVALSAFALTTYEYAKENIEEWVDKKKKQFKETMYKLWENTVNWIEYKRKEFKNFLDKLHDSFVSNIQKLSSWVYSQTAGYKYTNENPQIIVDTYKLKSYAQRIQTLNRRVSYLDNRLDSLYWEVGLADLWNLMQADLLTGYSWRLNRCISYLNDTANDFEYVESNLVNSI